MIRFIAQLLKTGFNRSGSDLVFPTVSAVNTMGYTQDPSTTGAAAARGGGGWWRGGGDRRDGRAVREAVMGGGPAYNPAD